MDELTNHYEEQALTIKLCEQNLSQLPAGISVPTYDRAALSAGIVHIGVGNFHRAHQAWYMHRLFELGHGLDWAIIGAGVRAFDMNMREKLLAQDCLTTLLELAPDSQAVEVIGSMIDYLPVVEGHGPLIDRMSAPDIRIVATTVTEGGYFIDPAINGFDKTHPDIVHDARNPRTPKTAFGAIVEALRRRKAAGLGPFTCLSCDNLQGNGDIFRQAVLSLAQMSDADLARWIAEEGAFPNSMVDCIVPATGENEISLARDKGIEDLAPVTHEVYRQWVIEDHFCAGRPNWQDVGVQFSQSVTDFELLKLRVLNGGHQVISVPGELLSIATISGCMQNDHISHFFRMVAQREILPHVKPVPGTTPEAYLDLICTRFANPKICDTSRRVAFDGSSRHPGFIIPSIRDGLAKGASVEGLALLQAAWARMCQGTREDGSRIEPNDPHWSELQSAATASLNDPAKWLAQRNIYGDLVDNDRLRGAFCKWLTLIRAQGVEAAMAKYCDTAH